MARGSYIAVNAAVVALLQTSPRTILELLDVLGLPRTRTESVRRWLRMLQAEGLVEQTEPKKNPRGRKSPTWKWVCQCPA